jgi:uncharacterized protein YecA (UPF0149 family)
MSKLLKSDVAVRAREKDAGVLFDVILGLPVVSQRVAPIIRNGPRVGRNDVCQCGSGKKFKNCCRKE